MKITIVDYRKAYPQEILFQLEPVLRKAGIIGWDIIGLFQEALREKGFEVYEVPDGRIGPPDGGDLRHVVITDEKENPINDAALPDAQVMRPSEIILRDKGAYQQGFRLHSRGWPAEKATETLFVPDYNGFHEGELVECQYDQEECVWKPTGKSKRVAALWNDSALPPN